MSDVETADDVAVSNNQVDADSLEFAVNTNLPLTAAKASPGGAAPSLQELIEAELSVRLLQPDSLEPPVSPALHSLLSCDSIEPILAPHGPALSLDSLTSFDPLKDTPSQADEESGIDILSPTKLDDFSNPDSLESSSDLPGSPTHCAPEPLRKGAFAGDTSQLLLIEDLSSPYSQQHATTAVENTLLIVEEEDLTVTQDDTQPLLALQNLEAPVSLQRDDATTYVAEQDIEISHFNHTESQSPPPPPPLGLTDTSELLDVPTYSHSGSEEQLELSESSADICRTSDSYTSDCAVIQDDADVHSTYDDTQGAGHWQAELLIQADDNLSDSFATEESLSFDKITRTASSVEYEQHTEPLQTELTQADIMSFTSSHSSSQDVSISQEYPSSSQDINVSPESPSSPLMPSTPSVESLGALSLSVTNSVCDGVYSNAGDMKVGLGDDQWDGDSPASGGGGGGEELASTMHLGGASSGEDILSGSDFNMDLSRGDDDDDLWGHQHHDDHHGGSRRRYFTRHEEEEEEEEEKAGGRRSPPRKSGDDGGDEDKLEGAPRLKDQDGEEQTGEGEHVDQPAMEGEARTEEGGKRAPTSNGVNATSAEKKKKKKSEDGEKKKKKRKKKKGESEKENMGSAGSSSRSGPESDEDGGVPPPTPLLVNGHAITNGLTPHSKEDIFLGDDKFSDRELQSDHEAFTKEDFHSLVEVYNKESSPKRELRAQTPLSDEDDLAGVNVKQLRVSYLSATQDKGQHSTNNSKCNSKPDIKADLNTSVNISSLVDTYSSPHRGAATAASSRPDDLTPVSLRSLKSAYEATATASSSAGSRGGSSSSSTPAGGSPAPKEELNISLQQLREEYCRSVQDGHSRSQTPTRTPPDTGISIKQLTRSFSDLTRLYDPIVSSPLSAQRQHDIPSRSVSVKKLRASYGDLPRLLSDSESGGHSCASLRLQSRLHTMYKSKSPHQQNRPSSSPLVGSQASHVAQQIPISASFQCGKIKSITVPKKINKAHSIHNWAHAPLDSKNESSVTCNGFVQCCGTSKNLHGRSVTNYSVPDIDSHRPSSKHSVSKISGKQHWRSSSRDVTRNHNTCSSSPLSVVDHHTTSTNTGSISGALKCAAFVGPVPPPPEVPIQRNICTGVSVSHMDPYPLYSLLHLHDNQASQVSSECKMCGKQVFQMEKIVAEKASWHKNCFRCKECNSLLTLETYQSHEGVLYCKPHFKDLFRPKAVIEDPDEARKERSTVKPDYGLEELSSANLKQKFAMFEQISTEEEHRPEPIPVRRSHSLLNRAAKFMHLEDDDYGVENSELGEYEEDDEDEEEEDEDGEEGDAENGEKIKTKKGRPTSFSGMQDLKAGWAQKNRREEMSRKRREELSKFRQMLCAGKNITTREMFESGNFDEQEKHLKRKEPIAIEGRPAAKNLRERFEKGLSMNEDEDDENLDRREVDDVLKNAETASKARNLFKKIDSAVSEEGSEPVMRPRSSAQARKENRLSRDGVDVEEQELGRDPNLIRCTDNYQDEVDCRKTRSVLAMFKKMEMQSEEEDRGPRPLKRFTPPPEGEGEDDSDEEEYSDEEYSDEDDEDDSEEDEDDEETDRKPKYKDEILEMSAKKAASLRAKFEKWETEVERNNEYNRGEIPEGEEECMPSIDTARNLRAMFENKAQEASRPVTNRPKIKVNRFVGGGGDECMLCNHTVYAMERLEVAGRVLHKNCFKCCKCHTKLNMNTFSIGGDDMYCTAHYKQAFAEKGTYDVFTPNKGKWTRKIEATNSEFPKNQE